MFVELKNYYEQLNEMNSKKIFNKGIIILIIAVIFYAGIIFLADAQLIFQKITQIDYKYFPYIFSILTIQILLSGVKFHRLLQKLKINLPYKESLMIFLGGFTIGITPGGSGALIKSYFLKKKHDKSISSTIPVIIIEKVTDLLGVLIIIAFFLIWVDFVESKIILGIGSGLFIIFFIIFTNDKIFFYFKGFVSKIKYAKKITKNLDEFKNSFQVLLNPSNFLEPLGITIVIKFMQVFMVYFIFLSVGINLDFFYTGQIYYTSLLIGFLSLIPAGLIITESSMISLLLRQNIDSETATLGVLFVRLVTTWIVVGIGVVVLRSILREKKPGMDKKISIYSLTTSYVRSDNLKRSHFVHVLNEELVKNGISVTTIIPHQKGSFGNETRDGVKIRRFKYLPERFELNETTIPEASKTTSGKFKIIIMSISFFIFTFFECLKEKPDILHGHWAYPSGYIAFLVSKIFRRKCIITIHGSDIPLLKKYTLIKKFVIPSLNKSSQIIANSEYAKKELIKMGINENKIIKIRVPPDFVEHEKDPNILEKFREKFTDSSTKIILFVGRLVEVKGVEYLIKSLSEIKNVNIHLIIVGDGPLKNKLQMLTKSLDLQDKVTFFGTADKNELGLLHQISGVIVCPSIIYDLGATEGLPMVIPEAMESGLPIIASSVGGIVDVVKNEETGLLVSQKNPKELAKAIERILLDGDLSGKIIENAKNLLREFLPENIVQKYIQVFKCFKN